MTYKLPAPDLYGPDGNSVKMLRYYTADTFRAEVAAAEKRGAEAMRERCAQVCANAEIVPQCYYGGTHDDAIRTLQVVEKEIRGLK